MSKRILKEGLFAFLLILLFTLPAFAAHLPIQLKTEDGKKINPLIGQNADQPYSPKNTCGSCHDYNTITEGYHFQMGWDVIDDNFNEGKSWILSNGMLGKWGPPSYRQLAAKENDSEDEIDLTPYAFAGSCGVCHPGGGGLERDRDGRRYDDVLSQDPGLKNSLDGDYFKSDWDKSGVLEADCLLCHLPDYDQNARNKQLQAQNYRWAPTAGSGLATVSGEVVQGETPQVVYNTDKFTSKGKAKLNIGSPEDKNCLACHGKSDMIKRGFSWNDEKNSDVHNAAGLSCVTCHPLVDTEETPKMQHQIAKGNANLGSVAPEYDNTVLSCEVCHSDSEEKPLNATVPKHESIKESHLDFISCEACHIPFKNRAAGGVVDVTTGSLVTLPNVQGTKGLKAEAKWQPELIRREDGKIYPVNTIHAVWWGNKNSDDKIVPLFLKEIKPAFEKVKSKVSDDNKDGKPEVNTQEEITAMLGALQDSLQGNKRLDRIHPVFVKGGKVYEFDSAGSLISEEHPLAEAEGFSVSHNVAPAEEALGANGCGDCHDSESRFVIGKITQDPFGPGGKPVFTSQGDVLGITPSVMGLHGTYQGNFNWLLIFAVLGVFVFCLAHYLIIGPNEKHLGKLPRDTVRYTGLERWTHNIRMISCILLMVTGSGFALYSMGVLKIFGGYSSARTIHIILGALFIITSIVATVIWMKKCVFKAYDIEWLKVMGGYLTKKECHPAAGCFNAGQKLFYWISTFLSLIIIVTGIMLINRDSISGNVLLATVFIHGASALTLIAAVVGHAYLGSFANPGTWKVLLDGKVAGEWCKVHHPYWKPEEKEEAK